MGKINQILQKWPQGTFITTGWLKEQGVSRQSVDNYKKSGWIEQVAHGVYKRKNEKVSWAGGVYTLQQLQSVAIHVGGRTALETQGFSHYGRMGQSQIILWKSSATHLPGWFQTHNWKSDLRVRSAALFENDDLGLSTTSWNQIPLTVSAAERAILEYLYDVPSREGFDEANYLMEGLASLRPNVLQELLEACKSIRAKRLFMYLADHYNHQWFQRLNYSTINLGRGKRELIKGGSLNKKYQIVVPKLTREDQ